MRACSGCLIRLGKELWTRARKRPGRHSMGQSIRIGRARGLAMKKLSQIRAGQKRRGVMLEAGFTLIELMIVITIILILIGMAAQRFEKSVRDARDATMKKGLT